MKPGSGIIRIGTLRVDSRCAFSLTGSSMYKLPTFCWSIKSSKLPGFILTGTHKLFWTWNPALHLISWPVNCSISVPSKLIISIGSSQLLQETKVYNKAKIKSCFMLRFDWNFWKNTEWSRFLYRNWTNHNARWGCEWRRYPNQSPLRWSLIPILVQTWQW